jgi:dihydrofolate reductase
MRKIIVEVEVSIDGCIGGENAGFWQQVFPFHTPDVQNYLDAILFEPDALLMGATTYKFFSALWPLRDGAQAERMNSMPKYVASRSLKDPLEWNASLLKGSPAEEIRKLKAQAGKDLLQYGVGELTRTMLEHRLVDEFRILVFPFTYGQGPRIFDQMGVNVMKLLETATFSSGAVALRYEPQSR